MENEQSVEHQPIAPEPAVSFPAPRQSQESNGFPKWIFAVIGLVIILAGGGFFLYQSSNAPISASPTPTPYVSGLDTLPSPTEEPTQAPSATPSQTPATTDRSGVTVQIQNGTGTTGDAALAKSIVSKLGYTKVTAGNASTQTATETTIIYSSDVPLAIVTELSQAIEKTFSPVKSQSGSGKMAITIITGPKGSTSSHTPAPTETP